MTHRPWTRRRKVIVSTTIVTTLVLGGGSAWALDRFLIPHVEISGVSAYEAQNSTVVVDDTGELSSEAVVTDTSYESNDASISISTMVTGSGRAPSRTTWPMWC